VEDFKNGVDICTLGTLKVEERNIVVWACGRMLDEQDTTGWFLPQRTDLTQKDVTEEIEHERFEKLSAVASLCK
jgi:hypothetical protein